MVQRVPRGESGGPEVLHRLVRAAGRLGADAGYTAQLGRRLLDGPESGVVDGEVRGARPRLLSGC
ncbi:hypothetical protein [Streptomyces sp. RFCAC02]|uniref:hypothetical protein n=1 Tax=Streptomyces sp. RFCAC02 TaxID=2499143 RepID=UPI0010215A93|nr:hypothetical protein [Streptomyces sp. RFCAC02]